MWIRRETHDLTKTQYTAPLSHPATDRLCKPWRTSAWSHPPTQLTSHPGLHYPIGKPFGLSPSVLLLRRTPPRLSRPCKHHSRIKRVIIVTRHHLATREENISSLRHYADDRYSSGRFGCCLASQIGNLFTGLLALCRSMYEAVHSHLIFSLMQIEASAGNGKTHFTLFQGHRCKRPFEIRT